MVYLNGERLRPAFVVVLALALPSVAYFLTQRAYAGKQNAAIQRGRVQLKAYYLTRQGRKADRRGFVVGRRLPGLPLQPRAALSDLLGRRRRVIVLMARYSANLTNLEDWQALLERFPDTHLLLVT